MATLLRWFGRAVLALCLLVLAYMLFALVAYRDIPTDVLIERYADDNLAFADVDGNRIAYRLDGQPLGSAPVVVLIHSHYFNSRMWDAWIPHLSDAFTLLRFDMTSHGLTGPEANNDYSMVRDIALMEGLFESLSLERFSLVGSSLGGNFAFHYAARHPEQVEHLVLINSGGLKRKQSSKRNAKAIPEWFYRVFYFVPELAYRRFIEWMVYDPSIVSDALVEEFHAMFRRSGNRQAELSRMRSFDVGEPAPVLAQVRAPVLIVWGENNPQLPTEQVPQFARLLVSSPRVVSKILPQAGHLLPVEKPEQSAKLTRRFLLQGDIE
ncbi:pimeloyl-ACP methyl ester carboxylesterase [Litorivivens lipolytica]|uniref:Pimeloyl-ACP methyl ester carboxylesterase n=1 Tax=Litorivivens lipolytica TaxID=1524264 RepID=A0A7W4W5P5_9GAMM|nr:alpha/beta hydrolase [Litorivivens lipolytica]MBB3047951.1 pimeloyl-ACP methyl ester carboxylesterase [Litorivivens lipolytica]